MTPILAAQNTPVKEGLSPEQLITNEYVDSSIGLAGP